MRPEHDDLDSDDFDSDQDEFDDDFDSGDDDDDAPSDTLPCPGCGGDIYEDAVRCPLCGEYIDRGSRKWDGMPMWWVVLGGLGLIAVITVMAGVLAFV